MSSANRVETIYIKADDNLSHFCHISKNLYNEGNYIVRQAFITGGVWIRYFDLCSLLIESENYRTLPIQTSQQILRVLDNAWKTFFGSIKAWKKDKSKFRDIPRLPRYKKKEGEFILVFTKTQVRIKDKVLRFPKKMGMEVKTRLDDDTPVVGARIVPQGVGYNLEIIYTIEVPEKRGMAKRILAIDLGVNNLVTAVNNIGEQPFIIKGGIVKSWNQYYNKKRAHFRSAYDRQNIKEGRRYWKLRLKRQRKIKHYFHIVSKQIIGYCIEHKIDTIVIGHNTGWKQNVNIGKRNNQNFVSIPFYKLTGQIRYKAEEKGITAILQEESHTSKCSFLDSEEIKHHDEYLGKRVKRGLFKSANGIKINSDVNGGYNILKKAFPEAFADGIEGIRVVPRRMAYDSSS